MRLFIAIEFNNIKEYLHELQSKIPKAKAAFPKHFHLTLKFLGEIKEEKIPEIIERLKEIKFEHFKLRLGNIGVFPNEKMPKVVWVGLKDRTEITKLQKEIEEKLGFLSKKDKRFHPHITIARIKHIEDKKIFIQHIKKIETKQKEIEITRFKLIKSTLTSKGPAYEDLEVFE